MHSSVLITASILAMVLAGCAGRRPVQVTPLPPRSQEAAFSSQPIPVLMPHSYTLVEQPLTLSVSRPLAQRGDCSVRLISIADDGTTRIRIVETGTELAAHPGEFFDSAEFGSQGLQLVSASKKTGVVSLISRGCISH
jgi:hypothetical protein